MAPGLRTDQPLPTLPIPSTTKVHATLPACLGALCSRPDTTQCIGNPGSEETAGTGSHQLSLPYQRRRFYLRTTSQIPWIQTLLKETYFLLSFSLPFNCRELEILPANSN